MFEGIRCGVAISPIFNTICSKCWHVPNQVLVSFSYWQSGHFSFGEVFHKEVFTKGGVTCHQGRTFMSKKLVKLQQK